MLIFENAVDNYRELDLEGDLKKLPSVYGFSAFAITLAIENEGYVCYRLTQDMSLVLALAA